MEIKMFNGWYFLFLSLSIGGFVGFVCGSDDGITKYLVLELVYDPESVDKVLNFVVYQFGEDYATLGDSGVPIKPPLFNKINRNLFLPSSSISGFLLDNGARASTSSITKSINFIFSCIIRFAFVI
mgnify:CR=1 FL=1